MSDSNANNRTRNWTCVLYPESAPKNWREILDDFHIEWIESPLHDSDMNANGEPKKAHIHLGLLFGGVQTYEQVCEITSILNATVPQKVKNMKSLVRYMAHLDNPEKAQYNIKDVIGHGGVDVSDLLKPTSSERYEYIKEMKSFCIDADVFEFADLFDYASENKFDTWFPLLCDSCAYVMQQFLTSRRNKFYGGKNNEC